MTVREPYDRDDPLLGAMFTASRAEAPSARAVEKTLAAIGTAAGVLSATAATHAATSALASEKAASIGWTLLAKWTGVGLATGLLTVGGAGVAERWVAPPAPAPVAPVADVASRSSARPAARAPGPRANSGNVVSAAPAVETAPVRASLPAPELSSAPSAAVASGRAVLEDVPGPTPAAPASGADALRPELHCIDGARAALRAGSFTEALSKSERCEREHPGGRLALEALLIRMHALDGMGSKAAARNVARQLLEVAPKSPHAARARALLGTPGGNSVIDPPPGGEHGSRRP